MMKKISLLVLIVLSSASPAIFSQEEASELKREEKDAQAQHELELKKLEAIREADPTTTEYTLSPGQVEMVVELDPNNYGFRTRNFRSTFGADFDLLFRGRAMMRYDYRFFEYFSLAMHAGVDFSQVSLYEKFRQNLNKPAPQQFSVLGGVSGKWRLTEWYLRSAVFLEPSLLVGHMWQRLLDQSSTHWRIKPGLFAGIDTVFDSGLAMQLKLGVEFPIDFAKANPVRDIAEPLMMFGLGFAL